MQLHIPRDAFDVPTPPHLFLCQTDKELIGELPTYGVSLNGKWNTYSELSFSMDRTYVDIITGETKVHPLFDKVEGLRKVYVKNVGYFVIQDPSDSYDDNETKAVSCFSSEYECGQKYLELFYVNTGEDASQEVTYHASQYGEDYYNADAQYKQASVWDAYTKYYVKSYNSNGQSYVYEQVQVIDEADYNAYDGSTNEKTLYVKSFPNVQFYNPSVPQLSLLNLVFSRIPDWNIGHVDASLRKLERTFSESRISVYDFLMNKVCSTFKCVIEWDTLTNIVNFYEEAEDGINDDNTIQTRWDTDVFISRENLASQLSVKYSTDNIKTKLKVSGGSDLDIREVNLGQNYIMNLDYYHTVGWMGQELYVKYDDYLKKIDEITSKYNSVMKEYVGSLNSWNDLVNEVPVDGNVLLVGDEFKKLYCTYIPVTEDENGESIEIETAIQTAVDALTEKLRVHKVYDDTKANKSDNVLLTLKDINENRATIRVYNKQEDDENAAPNYVVYRAITNASTGSVVSAEYSLNAWVNGELTNTLMELSEYKIVSIGTLGAYLCLATNESDPANLTEYGINLLKEKQATYTQIFITQTEGSYSQKDTSCMVGDSTPSGPIASGDRWLDTSNNNILLLKEYNGTQWIVLEIASSSEPTGTDWMDGTKWLNTSNPNQYNIYQYDATNNVWVLDENLEDDIPDVQDYIRYLENYTKLLAVEKVLAEKEKEAAYYLNGVEIQGRYITKADKGLLESSVQQYFGSRPIDYPSYSESFDEELGLYSFTITGDSHIYTVYLKNNIPYVSYRNSQGICLRKMEHYKTITDMDNFFTDSELTRLSPFIREDEFSDDNFALTGYESEEERLDICRELLVLADKELKTLSQPSLEFSMTMANILAIPEFDGIKDQFKLGNFIRVGVRPDYVKRARLLEVHINFDDISDFSATFGNLVTTKSEVDKHAELLAQAIQAGKTVASSASNWQRAVDKSNAIDDAINAGLQDATLNIGATTGQSIEIGPYGIWGRKLLEGTTDQYEDEQFRIINNKILFSDDAFQTSKALFGKFTYNNTEYYGPLADAVIGGYVVGSTIEGGSLKIGTESNYLKVDPDGSVTIKSGGKDAYVSTSDYENVVSSQPIVSSAEPVNVKDGQIWIKQNSDSSYTMYVWNEYPEIDEDTGESNIVGEWLPTDSEKRNKIYTSRPSSYRAGDLWITNSDSDHGVYLQGTLLQAQAGSSIYSDDDWTPTLKYDSELEEIQNTLNGLSQYVNITSDGLRIGAVYESGDLSPFTSLFTSTELAFYQNSEKLLTLANNKLNAPRVEVEDDLVVDGTFSLDNLKLTKEDNGSFSFTVSS